MSPTATFQHAGDAVSAVSSALKGKNVFLILEISRWSKYILLLFLYCTYICSYTLALLINCNLIIRCNFFH